MRSDLSSFIEPVVSVEEWSSRDAPDHRMDLHRSRRSHRHRSAHRGSATFSLARTSIQLTSSQTKAQLHGLAPKLSVAQLLKMVRYNWHKLIKLQVNLI